MSLQSEAECFTAGWDDGDQDEPLTPKEIDRLVPLHSPYLQPEARAS